jgi:UDP-N-acetyl-D-mannosaminuronate dehydrogenase
MNMNYFKEVACYENYNFWFRLCWVGDWRLSALVLVDALVLLAEWQGFRSPDFNRIKNTLKQAVIVDGRNIYDPLALTEAGFSYYGIGRAVPAVPALSLVASRDCA